MKLEANTIEEFEAYLNDQLPAAQRSALEKKLEHDPELREAFKRHRILVESIRLSSIQEEREKLQSIHRAMLAQEKAEKERTTPKEPRFRRRHLMSFAAVFLVGLLAGLFVVPDVISDLGRPPTTLSPDTSPDIFGNTGTGVPKFESRVPFIKQYTGENGQLVTNRSEVFLSIYEDRNGMESYELQDLRDPAIEISDSVEILALRLGPDSPTLQILLIKTKGTEEVKQIPISDEEFESLWNQ